jgi:hypothetical protein
MSALSEAVARAIETSPFYVQRPRKPAAALARHVAHARLEVEDSVGLKVILSLELVDDHQQLGLVGLIPLATGLIGVCPLYRLFGASSCRTRQ